jgi:3,4-dihydroxy 2-butanone 4-phosphate synthase/GTP cyclohydrolase II
MVVLYDDNAHEGILLLAAAAATKHTIAVMVRHTSGMLRATMTGEALDRLGIPPMLPRHEEHAQPRFAVAVDARTGVTTGISATDRARTFRLLADPCTRPDDLTRPGHVIPEYATAGGTLRHPGRADAAVVLAQLAGLTPVTVIGELVDDTGTVSSWTQSREFAHQLGLAVVTIADIMTSRANTTRLGETG